MSRKIIYLINPISGTHGKASVQQLITRRTQKEGIEFNILPTNAEGNYAFLLPLIREQQVTDIVVCGGDGTLSAVLSSLRGSDVRVGIVPMGSGNGLAFAAKIPKDPSKALDIVFAAKAALIDGFLINGQFSCMLCGIGFDGNVAHEFAVEPKRGLQTYIKVTLRNFFKARPWPFYLTIPAADGNGVQAFPVDAFFIDIANGDQFGNHFTIAPRASLHDGLLDIVVVKKTNRLFFLLAVIRQVLGGYKVQARPDDIRNRTILYFQTSTLTVGNSSQAPVHIDGDPMPPAPEYHITVVPKAINLIQP
jgi:YegS/Rv2252/BmrU family lipid kinase